MLHSGARRRALLYSRLGCRGGRSGRRFFDNRRARIQKHGHREERRKNDQFFHSLKLFLHRTIGADASTRCISGEVFRKNLVRSVFDARTQALSTRALPFGFEDALLQRARPRPALPANLFPARDFSCAVGFLPLRQGCGQTFPSQLAIERLRAGILNRDANSGRQMTQRHRGRNLIHVLPARASRTGERFLEVGFAQHGI